MTLTGILHIPTETGIGIRGTGAAGIVIPGTTVDGDGTGPTIPTGTAGIGTVGIGTAGTGIPGITIPGTIAAITTTAGMIPGITEVIMAIMVIMAGTDVTGTVSTVDSAATAALPARTLHPTGAVTGWVLSHLPAREVDQHAA